MNTFDEKEWKTPKQKKKAEKWVNVIFSPEKVVRFLEALFCIADFQAVNGVEYNQKLAWSKEKFTRLKRSAQKILTIVGDPRFARKINPEGVRALTQFGESRLNPTITALQAICSSREK